MNHLNLSFAACGFLGIYHLGAASALLKHGQKMLKTVRIFAGASAGSLVAAVMLTAPHKIKESKDFIFQFSEDVRKQTFGALTPRYDFLKYLREGIETILPANAHDAAQNRLYISVTNTKSWENSLVSSFASREELVEKWFDGGFSNSLPIMPTGRTITVSPFSGLQDICPKDKTHADMYIKVANQDMLLSAANFQRISHALFPPNQAKMEFVFQDGFEDAVNFLHSENWGRRRHRQDDFLDKQNSVIKGFYGLCK
ncbi:patatin-like phospholipase domain-containing protein 4 isoform X2 [Rana temporaria]|uniref:patatin-like phospholipase domain-containing protein 4 isoform X2 n=1 Tax=Rana temporaria TaxID=8407 RepID=UPI001AADD685|nr:patatin-like phospholipase domain-containing protein 4 isoform X2 [Rana temporaria]